MRKAAHVANVFHTIAGLFLGASLCAACSPPPTRPVALEVSHSWTSPGEVRAINEIVQAYETAGGRWRNFSLAGFQNTQALVISRIIGGRPPGAVNFVAGPAVHDLAEHGLLTPLDTVAQQGRWRDVLPRSLYDSLVVQGHVYSAPLNVHLSNWMFGSMPALRRAGVTAMPASWPEFFDDLERLKHAGVVPLAFGGQPWQEAYVFNAVFLSKGGAGLYLAVYRDRNVAALRSPAFRDVVETFGRLRPYADPGAPGRNWNDATAMVVAGRAGFQIMGDWVQSEFRRAGLTPGVDYGCTVGVVGGGANYFSDVFVFPRAGAQVQPGQLLLAQVATAPAVQARFAGRLGALPAFDGGTPAKADLCEARARQAMALADRSAPTAPTLVAPDVAGDLEDAISAYWAGEISEDAFIQRFATTIATAT